MGDCCGVMLCCRFTESMSGCETYSVNASMSSGLIIMSGVNPGGSKCCDWLCIPWNENAVTPDTAALVDDERPFGEPDLGVRTGDEERLPPVTD